ncbi:hypothetical protein QMM68_23170 [Serratia sp. Se-RSBMAAmG]|nr:hypothetical protein [Serratia sp. Se-RSBMAAmG]
MRIKGVYLLFLIVLVGCLADKGLVSQPVGKTMHDLMVIFSYAYVVLIGLRAFKEFITNRMPFSVGRNFMFQKIDIGLMFVCAIMCHLIGWNPSDTLLLICTGLCVYINGKLPSGSDF